MVADSSTPDPDAWTLHLDLPDGAAPSSGEVYPVVTGVAPDHGAKPEPMYWDEAEQAWWSPAPGGAAPVTRLVWTVDLVQLGFQPEESRRPFLEGVLAELEARAARLGASVRPEGTIAQALERLPAVFELAQLRAATVSVNVVPPEPASMQAWWRALKDAGLSLGDGDLFWIDADTLGFEGEHFEICAEPLTSQAYFHPGDLDGPVTFPDVTLSFEVTAPREPEAVVPVLVALAERIAAPLGAKLEAPDGGPWSRERAIALIERVQGALAASP